MLKIFYLFLLSSCINLKYKNKMYATSNDVPRFENRQVANAVIRYDLEMACFWVCKGANVNIDFLEKNGLTLLLLASALGDKERISWLLYLGANFYVQRSDGSTVLTDIVKLGYKDVLDNLISRGLINNFVIHHRDFYNCNAVIYSLMYNQKEITKSLLKQGANVHDRDANGRSLLILAAESNKLKTMIFLLNEMVDIDYTEVDKLLDIAMVNLNKEIINFLVAHKNFKHFNGLKVFRFSIYKQDEEIKDILKKNISKMIEYYENLDLYTDFNVFLAISRLHSNEIFNYDRNIKEIYLIMLKKIINYLNKAINKLNSFNDYRNLTEEIVNGSLKGYIFNEISKHF